MLDYVNVYDDINGADAIAVSRAYGRAAVWGDDVIVAELQMALTDASQPSIAADDAFDQGIAVIGAVGNTNVVSSPASPGNAHKALAVGDYDAVSGATVSQVSGLVGGRIKPDLQAPSNVQTASKFNDTDTMNYGGTSAATAFAGGAAAIMYEWYTVAFGLFNRPGNLYTALLAQGNGGNMPGLPKGVGKLKMESASWWWSGQITLGTSAQELPFSIPAGRKNMKVAIWWPERQSDAHNDVDLTLLGPGVFTSSTHGGSVWEKCVRAGNLTPGNYAIRFSPYSMPRPNQVVYFTVVTSFQ